MCLTSLPPPQKGGDTMKTARQKAYTHITYDMRVFIERCVIEGKPLSFIASQLGIDATSISRELKRNRRCDGKIYSASTRNTCANRRHCSVKNLCSPTCTKRCSSCARFCNASRCKGYEEQRCATTGRAPWVCNGCNQKTTCPLERWAYSARAAQVKAESRLSESRKGLNMTQEEAGFLASVVREGLSRGQSVHHIFASNKDLPCSERSFYRHVENESIGIRKMDLRKKVRYKKRAKAKERVDSSIRCGRTFKDYMALDERLRESVVQVDCVEGVKEDVQALLTMHFASLRFQIYILLERKDSEHVVRAFDWIEQLVGKRRFKRLFGLVLADRGAEFSDVGGMEKGGRCSVYFTDPQRADQKGACEKNHVELRKIIPKGTSIDALALDPWLVGGICSHVNSSLRRAIGDACPMALAQAALPASLLEGLGLTLISPRQVQARPKLIEELREERDNIRG